MSVHELNPQYARVISLHRVTIRYLLMFVHRRDVEQSSVSRSPLGATGCGYAIPNLISAFY